MPNDKIEGLTKLDLEEAAQKLRELPVEDFQKHDLIQQGYYIIDRCCNRSIAIKPGTQLVGKKGEWKIEKEPVAST